MTRRDLAAGALCMALGILISAAPHALWLGRIGEPVWIADDDELFYLAVGTQALENHPTRLADPAVAENGHSIYRPLPLLPGVWLAKLFRLGPAGIGLAWRIWAGATIGLAWYALARDQIDSPALAAALAVCLLSDCGTVEGRPLVKQASVAMKVALDAPGDLFVAKPEIHTEWRISTPGVTMAYLALFILFVSRARERPGPIRIGSAGIAFGLLFHVYFYYWTAAAVALGISWIIDFKHKRVYFLTAMIGGLVGLPAVVSDAVVKVSRSSDWLERTDKFLPIDRFSELLLPKVAIFLVVLMFAWVWIRRRDLTLVWALSAAGVGLMNHQVVSGLQIENFHWVYVWGPCQTLLLWRFLGLEIVPRFKPREPLKLAVAVAGAGTCLAVGLWLRIEEAARSSDSVANMNRYIAYRSQRLRSPGGASRLEPNSTIAGDPGFVSLAAIFENQRPFSGYCVTLSPSIINEEWDFREGAAAAFLGEVRSEFEARAISRLENAAWGPWNRERDPGGIIRSERVRGRILGFEQARERPGETAASRGVRYLALPVEIPDPGIEALGRTLLQAGPSWRLWELRSDSGRRPPINAP